MNLGYMEDIDQKNIIMTKNKSQVLWYANLKESPNMQQLPGIPPSSKEKDCADLQHRDHIDNYTKGT